MPLQLAFILYSWSYANEPVHLFSGIQLKNSYVKQESNTLLEELMHYNQK